MLGSALAILLLASATTLHAGSPGLAKEPTAPPAFLTIAGAPTDSVLLLTLTLTRESFVDIGIFDLVGGAMEVPVHSPMPAGEHVICYDKARLTPGRYIATLTLDHVNRVQFTGFTHFSGLPTPTDSPEEHRLLRRIINFASEEEAVRALAAFDTLVQAYPHNLDKGAAYYWVLPLLAEQGDSTRILDAADSLVHYLPRADYYYHISQATIRYPATARHYAQLALSAVDQKPSAFQDDLRFQILRHLGDLYTRHGDPEAAATTLEQALSVFHHLPPTSGGVVARHDRAVCGMLADLREQRGDFKGALHWREKAVAKDAPDSWLELQRTYALAYGSDVGYEPYARILARMLPGDVVGMSCVILDSLARTSPADVVDTPPTLPSSPGPFPDFELPALDGGRLSLADLKGSPAVVVFWGYWCGSCLKEMSYVQQLVDRHGDKGLKAVAIHGHFPSQPSEEDQLRYVRRALSRSGVSFPTVIDDQADLYARLGIAATPTTYLLDRSGNIFLKFEGYDPDALSSAVSRLLGP